jgi:putative ABC transport system permease protein
MSTDGIGTVTVAPEGFVLPPGTDNLSIFSARVDEDYFSTMAIPIVKGRGVRAQDTAETPGVAIVNETLAGKYWPGQEVLGKRLKLTERGSTSWLEVVGVAKDSKYLFLAERPTDFVYVPYRQHRQNSMAVVAQSADAPASLVEPMRSAVRELDANQPIFSVYSMETFYEMRTLSIFNTIAETIAAMGLMGLALSITGLYGLVAFAVNRRTREIGIRMAIGAGRGSVLRMVLRQGMLLAVIGLAIGLLAGAGAQQMLLAAFQSADRTFRPMSVIIVAVLVLAVTFVASYIPARRAAALDPMKALRYE